MAFKCEKCGIAQQAGTKETKRVVATRQVSYTNYDDYGKVIRSSGHEIVKELKVCPYCA